MKGRKPVPTALKLVRGNPGRRPIATDELKPRPWVGTPPCPSHLRGDARKEWRRLVKVLGGVVTPADRGALAQLCTAWGRYCYAEKMIAESTGNEGLVVQSKESRPMLGPWLAISNRAIEIHSKLCAEFGLTPSSRTRIHTGVPQRPPEPSEGPKKKAGWEQFS